MSHSRSRSHGTMSRCASEAGWLELIEQDPIIVDLVNTMDRGGTVRAAGRAGCSTHVILAALHQLRDASHLLITAHLDEADEAIEVLGGLGIEAIRFPAIETLPGEGGVRPDLLIDRMIASTEVSMGGESRKVVVAPIHALMQRLPLEEELEAAWCVLRPGDSVDRSSLVSWFIDAGHARVVSISDPGEFAVRGDIIDVFPLSGLPARIDMNEDIIESIRAIDLDTMGSDRRVERLDLLHRNAIDPIDEVGSMHTLLDRMGEGWSVVVDDLAEVAEQAASYMDRIEDPNRVASIDEVLASATTIADALLHVSESDSSAEVHLPARSCPVHATDPVEAIGSLPGLAHGGHVVLCCRTSGDASRCSTLVESSTMPPADRDAIKVVHLDLPHGFRWNPSGGPALALVAYDELLHRAHVRRRRHAAGEVRPLDAFIDVQPGDMVVHSDHGIARFAGLTVLSRGDTPEEEFLTLEFAKEAKLHVPVADIELVQKYIGAFRGQPDRSILGGKSWSRRKGQASESVRDLAAELLRVQAAREGVRGMAFPADTPWQQEFEASFPWDETEDQLEAIAAVKRDMESLRPMDRLLCGDVGFGKTEVAIRAAFKSIESGRQAAVLVPTTVLAEQHERTFASRYAGFPFRVASLSRFKTAGEQRELVEDVAAGAVDVLIGTHRILSNDVVFSDLGLVVIDEEQRFGVEHKQKLLQMRATVDVLTMTATPIPRTLHMSMLGLRDISSLRTAPLDRRAVVTELISWSDERIKSALHRELAREGQAFVVHNRVNDLDDLAQKVRLLVPGARVVIGHGQMPPRMLERVMLQFTRGEADILVCTTIVESGIDIPTANTMIIDEADLHGLADLHQLRGRVGRFRHRAYCYLVLPQTRMASPDAMRRLKAVESFSMLGAGFRIALRDLEIRGAGNLLGPEQSGHIAAVGYELYCRLLEQAVENLKEGRDAVPVASTIDLGIGGLVPRAFVPDDARRMDVYRRLARAGSVEELESIVTDIKAAYGALPSPVQNLVELALVRILATMLGISSIRKHESDIIFRASLPQAIEQRLKGLPGMVRMVGGMGRGLADAEIWWRPSASSAEPGSMLALLRNRLQA